MMEAPLHQRSSSLSLGPQLQANYKSDHHLAIATSVAAKMAVSGCGSAATTAAETAYLQQLHQTTAVTEANGNNGARGEQSPRCASHDTRFCYYKNYNTSHPRHFCRACRRYWTLGGSLRNVPIGGSTRKCPRLAHPTSAPPASRRHVVFGGGSAAAPPTGLLGSLFALGGAAPVREGRSGSGFELGRGLPMPSGAGGAFGGDGEICAQMQGLGVRDGLGGASELLWPAGLLDNGIADEWKVPSVSEATWPEFSAAVAPPQAGGLLHGGAQLM